MAGLGQSILIAFEASFRFGTVIIRIKTSFAERIETRKNNANPHCASLSHNSFKYRHSLFCSFFPRQWNFIIDSSVGERVIDAIFIELLRSLFASLSVCQLGIQAQLPITSIVSYAAGIGN